MTNQPTAFVIMPFDADFTEVYDDFISPILEEVGFAVHRADDPFDQQNILRNIIESLHESYLVVADLTNLNPNVFYELGVAHAFGQRVILLTQDIEELPFDLRSYRVIQYGTHFRRIEEARQKLRETAAAALNGTIAFGSPVTDYLPTFRDAIQMHDTSAARDAWRSRDETESTASTDDEPGWLDHLDALENGYETLTSQLHTVTEATSAIGSDTKDYSTRLRRIKNTAGSARISAARTLTNQYGKRLEQYGEQLSSANSEYEAILGKTQNSVELIISRASAQSDDEKKSLNSYLGTLRDLVSSATDAGEKLRSMRVTTKEIEGVERGMTRAARIVGLELDRFVGNIEQTIASAKRGIEIGEQKLSDAAR